MKNHYDVLKIAPNATQEEITKAYRKLSLSLHPDKHMNDSSEQQDHFKTLFQQLQEAYRVLSNPSSRATYDFCSSNPGIPAAAYEGAFESIGPFILRMAKQITDLPTLQGIYDIHQELYDTQLVVKLSFQNAEHFFQAIVDHINFETILNPFDKKLARFFNFLCLANHPFDKLKDVVGSSNLRVDIYLSDIIAHIKSTSTLVRNKKSFSELLQAIDKSQRTVLGYENVRMKSMIVELLLDFVHSAEDLHDVITPLSPEAKRIIARVLDNELKPVPAKNGTFYLRMGDHIWESSASDSGRFVIGPDAVFSVGFDDQLEPLQKKVVGTPSPDTASTHQCQYNFFGPRDKKDDQKKVDAVRYIFGDEDASAYAALFARHTN